MRGAVPCCAQRALLQRVLRNFSSVSPLASRARGSDCLTSGKRKRGCDPGWGWRKETARRRNRRYFRAPAPPRPAASARTGRPAPPEHFANSQLAGAPSRAKPCLAASGSTKQHQAAPASQLAPAHSNWSSWRGGSQRQQQQPEGPGGAAQAPRRVLRSHGDARR